MRDQFGRTIDYLRVSLTDRCNLKCIYCMPEEGIPLLPHEEILRIEEILEILREMARLGLKRVRLTGGEPLVRRGLIDLIREAKHIQGLEEISLTTNGTFLKGFAGVLKREGVKRVNIGLPSLDPEKYRKITRLGDLKTALDGLNSAIEEGFNPLKINTVLLKGLNDDPVPFFELISKLEVEVRFIELMPVGRINLDHLFISQEEFLKKIPKGIELRERESLEGNGPARKSFFFPGSKGSISFIPALTGHFCRECNRLRLTADGHLKPCLFSNIEIDLKPALRPAFDSENLRGKFNEALFKKPKEKDLFNVSKRFMTQIGG
ncbi:MAG: GTP 3',8-cyclase MoaA [Caldiserica bacterium]|jgi:cyclic pyranopterin phosphate synthase|nr:GTP 3',8-cyclase MoaA [Caldisericota bacterium]MDH7563107.1 GTP 3',8-cyclase MoaA [Caldisericota bacterium]